MMMMMILLLLMMMIMVFLQTEDAYSAERAARKPQARDVQQADKHRWQDTITLVQAFS